MDNFKSEVVYTIQGIEVKFPCKAYPSQLSMMNKILQGIKREQNCLLESPTGSGKSLALLCACLAWQDAEHKAAASLIAQELASYADGVSVGPMEAPPLAARAQGLKGADKRPAAPASVPPPHDAPARAPEIRGLSKLAKENDDDHDDDFRAPKIYRPALPRLPLHARPAPEPGASSSLEARTNAAAVLTGSAASVTSGPTDAKASAANSSGKQAHRYKVAKIYFGTRTHKQIAQIIRELKKTAYRNAKMCILGSREHTCVHPEVSQGPHKNDECKELLENGAKGGVGCRYFYNTSKNIRTYACLEASGQSSPWDLEDLVKWGKKIKVCPYYTTRALKDEADIIFCPYNYLIDPLIRASMEIYLNHHIVVLDEAHNMEDSAREAASFTVSQQDLQVAVHDLERIARLGAMENEHLHLAQLLSQLNLWITRQSDSLNEYENFIESSKVWMGVEFIAILKNVGWGPEQYPMLMSLMKQIRQTDELDFQKDENNRPPTISSATLNLLTGLLLTLGYLYKDEFKYMEDYRIVITRNMVIEKRPADGVWINRNRKTTTWSYCLNFWCLNPAVAFSDFSGNVTSVILTSGTLSPMESFESELGLPFKIKLEANHVISKKQVWVGVIGHGSNGVPLNATFRNTEAFSFQDELGKTILSVCEMTPHGVLCFMTSYNMMEKMMNRWTETGCLLKLQAVKEILTEPRGSDKLKFDNVLQQFYEAIRDTENLDGDESGTQTGALLFAVCRGKISEGLDFADNNARAVITVGIPFPNVKDVQVDLKRKYNNTHCRTRNLLTGDQWYEVQAFRALNQALGRCIRHRNDWGALILIEERFLNRSKYTDGLSKWVRQWLQRYPSGNHALESLTSFMHQKQEMGTNEDTSFSPSKETCNKSGIIDMDETVVAPTCPTSPFPQQLAGLQADASRLVQSKLPFVPPSTSNKAVTASSVVDLTDSPTKIVPTTTLFKPLTPQPSTSAVGGQEVTPVHLPLSESRPDAIYSFRSSVPVNNIVVPRDCSLNSCSCVSHSPMQETVTWKPLQKAGMAVDDSEVENYKSPLPSRKQPVETWQEDQFLAKCKSPYHAESGLQDHRTPPTTDLFVDTNAEHKECCDTPPLFETEVFDMGFTDEADEGWITSTPVNQNRPDSNVKSIPRSNNRHKENNALEFQNARELSLKRLASKGGTQWASITETLSVLPPSQSMATAVNAKSKRSLQWNTQSDNKRPRDLLDDLDEEFADTLHTACFPGIQCTSCGTCLLPDLTNVQFRKIGPAAMQDLKSPSPERTSHQKCNCSLDGWVHYAVVQAEAETILMKLKDNQDLWLNAHWCPADGICLQTLVCTTCTSDVAFKVVAASTNKYRPGEVWFLPRCTLICPKSV